MDSCSFWSTADCKTPSSSSLAYCSPPAQLCSQSGSASSEPGWVSWILHCSQLLMPPPQWRTAALSLAWALLCQQHMSQCFQPIPAGARLALTVLQQAWRAGAAVEGPRLLPRSSGIPWQHSSVECSPWWSQCSRLLSRLVPLLQRAVFSQL